MNLPAGGPRTDHEWRRRDRSLPDLAESSGGVGTCRAATAARPPDRALNRRGDCLCCSAGSVAGGDRRDRHGGRPSSGLPGCRRLDFAARATSRPRRPRRVARSYIPGLPFSPCAGTRFNGGFPAERCAPRPWREPNMGCASAWISSRLSGLSRAQLAAMVDEATVDCHDEDEQVAGLHTMLVENLAVPFQTQVLGVDVTVEDIDLTGRAQIVAICCRGR